MAAPSVATYSVATLVAAHTAFRDLVDAGAGPGAIKIRSATDVLLAQIPLSYPCGTVNGTTGQFAFSINGPDPSANASGTAAYGDFCDAAGVVHLSLPTDTGTASVSGKLIINTLTLVSGMPVEVISATVG